MPAAHAASLEAPDRQGNRERPHCLWQGGTLLLPFLKQKGGLMAAVTLQNHRTPSPFQARSILQMQAGRLFSAPIPAPLTCH